MLFRSNGNQTVCCDLTIHLRFDCIHCGTSQKNILRCCFVHLKNSCTRQRFLYNQAIFSAEDSILLVMKTNSLQFFIIEFNLPEFVWICFDRFIHFKHFNLTTFYSGCFIGEYVLRNLILLFVRVTK